MRGIQTFLVASAIAFLSQQVYAADDNAPKPRDKPMSVAVLIFEGVELLDFAGPAEVFAVADYGRSFKVFTVSHETKPIRTMGGIRVTPDYAFEQAPQADILVIPGGKMSNAGPAAKTWIKEAAEDSEVVMSVCMGAFLLAESGLLEDIEATTHRWGIAGLRRAAPKCKVVSGKRFVDSGRVVTTAGVTAGIDGALHLVERFYGKEAADWTANEWMEYRRPTQTPAISE
jgi:transcriptional regulator GlxA family with amidase domain